MRLYLVERTDGTDWDEHDAVVIAAACEGDVELDVLARSTTMVFPMSERLVGFTAGNFTIRQIAARTTEPAGIVLASFNAG